MSTKTKYKMKNSIEYYLIMAIEITLSKKIGREKKRRCGESKLRCMTKLNRQGWSLC